MADLPLRRRLYWTRFTDGSGRWAGTDRPPGEELAALRQGAGREPGTVSSLWSHHAIDIEAWVERHRDTWSLPSIFQAEHHALTLYGFHQQSVAEPMHADDVGLGRAMLILRQSGRASEEAIDRRFKAAATADTVAELAQHLRRLVALLRGAAQPLDYTRLLKDLDRWHWPASQGRVRRTWGLQYYTPSRQWEGEGRGEKETTAQTLAQ